MSEVKIQASKLRELERAAAKLDALEAGGVDNWEWYDEALKEYRETIEQDEKLETLLDDLLEVITSGICEPAGSGCGYGIENETQIAALNILKSYNIRFNKASS